MKEMAIQNLLSVRQAAERLGLSRQRVQQFCSEERIGTMVDGRYVISEDELRLFRQIPRSKGRPPKDDEDPKS